MVKGTGYKSGMLQDENGMYRAEEKNILHRVVPEEGMAIIFNHHRLHEGAALRSASLDCTALIA